MRARPLVLALLVSPVFLTACGEGYELIRTDNMFPYGNQRTAGSNVAYVLAKMMPEKTLKVEAPAPQADVMQPVQREMKPKAISNEKALNDLRDMFAEEQRK
ncbi:MAG: hypothetical protein ACLFR0_05060 [Alphaproteobacteria bacterium]